MTNAGRDSGHGEIDEIDHRDQYDQYGDRQQGIYGRIACRLLADIEHVVREVNFRQSRETQFQRFVLFLFDPKRINRFSYRFQMLRVINPDIIFVGSISVFDSVIS